MDRYKGEKISNGIVFGKIFFFDGINFSLNHEAMLEDVILVAVDITPRDVMCLVKNLPVGVVTTFGTVNSHSSILLRNLMVTVVSNIPVKREWNGRMAVIDAYNGEVIIDPDRETLNFYRNEQIRLNKEEKKSLEKYRHIKAVTLDGKRIKVYANISRYQELLTMAEEADGIGVFKTEFFYMEKNSLPTEEEQFLVYRDVVKSMGRKRTVIRTIDIGVDKKPDYFDLLPEPNPSLGYRGIRISLKEKHIFLTQLRAILRASAYGKVAIMYPMIVSVEEVRMAKEMLENAKQTLQIEGLEFDSDIEQGIMMETPAAVMISKELAKEVDFFSIGTNDLMQYILVADRQNTYVRELLNPYHLGVVRSIQEIVKNAHKAGIWVEVSGELSADPDYARLLISIGIDALAVTPSKILKVKKTVCEFSSAQVTRVEVT